MTVSGSLERFLVRPRAWDRTGCCDRCHRYDITTSSTDTDVNNRARVIPANPTGQPVA